MGRFWDDTFGEAFALVFGIGVLLVLGLAVGIAYYLLLSCMLAYRHRQFLLTALSQASDVLHERGGDGRAEDIAYAIFGAKPSGSGSHNVTEVLWGREVQ
jgi:hypothetical protein